MALRSVVDIDVNTQAFDAYLTKFNAYRGALANLPAINQRISSGLGQQRIGASHLADALAGVHKGWDAIANTTTKVARTVKEIVSSMFHMATVMGTITSVATLGGLFGADVLGKMASGMRRSSLGMGTSVGGQRSFDLNYSRFIDTQSFMGGINKGLLDPRNSIAMRALGMSPQPGADTGNTASEALERIYRLVQSQPENQLGFLLQSRRLDELGISHEDLRRLKHTSPEEFRKQQEAERRDRAALNVTDSQGRGWQDFVTALSRSTKTIETTFITGLAPLAPAFTVLLKSVNEVIDDFLTGHKEDLKKWIEDLAKGIKDFATYLGSAEFKASVKSFSDGVVRLAGSVVEGLKKLGIISRTPEEKKAEDERPRTPTEQLGRSLDPWKGGAGPPPRGPGRWKWEGGFTLPKWVEDASDQHSSLGSESDAEKQAHDYFKSKGWNDAQTAGLLANIKGESGFNTNAFNPAGGGEGAQGIGQWRGKRIQDFRDRYHHELLGAPLAEQLEFQHWELTHTEKASGDALARINDPREAAAHVLRSYSRAGEADTRRGIPQRGDWAAGYNQRYSGVAQPNVPVRVNVTVRNEAGGNAVISSGQVAAA